MAAISTDGLILGGPRLLQAPAPDGQGARFVVTEQGLPVAAKITHRKNAWRVAPFHMLPGAD